MPVKLMFRSQFKELRYLHRFQILSGTYSTAHVQVYKKKMRVTLCALRNFEDNSRVGLVQHKEYFAHERLLTS